MTDEVSTSKRAAKRDSLFLMADLLDESGQAIGPARVRNLSATGLMAEAEGRFAEGGRVSFALRGAGTVNATISWVRGGRIGLVFDETIDPQSVRRPVTSGGQPTQPTFNATRFSRTLR